MKTVNDIPELFDTQDQRQRITINIQTSLDRYPAGLQPRIRLDIRHYDGEIELTFFSTVIRAL